MSLDNLNCPQFVDFTDCQVFNSLDGADKYFGKNFKTSKIFIFLNMFLTESDRFVFELSSPSSNDASQIEGKKDSGISVSSLNHSSVFDRNSKLSSNCESSFSPLEHPTVNENEKDSFSTCESRKKTIWKTKKFYFVK